VTLYFSRNTASVAMVIPAMDRVDKDFATRLSETNTALAPKSAAAIQAALALGKRTMNKYYERTDYSELYRIAMGMFPVPSDSRISANICYST
jgi:transposase